MSKKGKNENEQEEKEEKRKDPAVKGDPNASWKLVKGNVVPADGSQKEIEDHLRGNR